MTDREKAHTVTQLIADQLKAKSSFVVGDVEERIVALLRAERTNRSVENLTASAWNEALDLAAREADRANQVALAAKIRALKR